MKALKLLALAAFALLFSQCKTTAPTASSGPAPSLLEVQQILDTTAGQFLQYADSTNGDPWGAIMLTANWVKLQPNVQSVVTIDSTYLNIFLKSGLEADFFFNQVNDSGHSIFRGGASKSPTPAHISFSTLSKNTITNKKVLIYAPAWTEFNLQSTVPKTISTLTNSGIGLDVTLLKDEECTPAIANTFKDYGLVILDTHGEPNKFMSGTIIDIQYNNLTQVQYKDAFVLQAGQDVYDRIMSQDYTICIDIHIPKNIPNWQKRKDLKRIETIFVSTQYIKTLAPMPNTVIFGNMCYSGYSAVDPTYITYPIKTAFMDKNPICYYGYAFDNGISEEVTDQFSKDMEDSLTKRLVNDLDSTGIANLRPSDGAEFFDNYLDISFGLPPNRHITLLFKHFGADDYSYQKCGDTLVDARDGQKYATVCIGKQVWMAQNLNYDVPGGVCYDNKIAECDTFGKLYDWATIMQGAASSNAIPSGVRGVCPKGWHVPSDTEWAQAIFLLGGTSAAAIAMEAPSLWMQPSTSPSTNSSGVSVLPGGYWAGGTLYVNILYNAFFRTATELNATDDKYTVFDNNHGPNVYRLTGSKTNGLSCRCVKDP